MASVFGVLCSVGEFSLHLACLFMDLECSVHIVTISTGVSHSYRSLIMHPAGRRPGTAVGGERARPGRGHSILLLPHDLPISGPEKAMLN